MNLVNALILCGGQSVRMGTEKWQLDYHGQPQAYHLAQVVGPLVHQVALSVTNNQLAHIHPDYTTITDHTDFAGHGPISGLLSAFRQWPGHHVLLLACDYPLLQANTLWKLLAEAGEELSTLVHSTSPEPLLAFYPASTAPALLTWFHSGNYSLAKFIQQQPYKLVHPCNALHLQNCNTPHDYEAIKKYLQANK